MIRSLLQLKLFDLIGVKTLVPNALKYGDSALEVQSLGCDREDFESLVSFAATRATHAVSGMVGVIPLPAVGGVMLSDVDVQAASGYVRVDGRLTH